MHMGGVSSLWGCHTCLYVDLASNGDTVVHCLCHDVTIASEPVFSRRESGSGPAPKDSGGWSRLVCYSTVSQPLS